MQAAGVSLRSILLLGNSSVSGVSGEICHFGILGLTGEFHV